MKTKHLLAAAMASLCLMSNGVNASADTFSPYLGYEINDYDESVAAPISHTISGSYTGYKMGLDTLLSNPQDMYYTDGQLYILDSGNGRIVVTTPEFEKAEIIENFTDKDGNEFSITDAKGITVDKNGSIFIADTVGCRILKYSDGYISMVIERPDDALINSDTPFNVSKLLTDTDGRLYALVESVNMGAFVFDENGVFQSFYGSNNIVQTAEVIANYIRKQFLTAEQREGMMSITPVAFTGFDIDENGFIYTVTADGSEDAKSGVVRWLNYKGSDILDLDELSFGDVEKDGAYWSESLHTQFSDVDVDPEGYINIIDTGRGKVFQYTTDGKLTSVFGGYGNQQGTFSVPMAVESIGEDVYILDSEKAAVFVFSPTIYGSKLREAIKKTDENSPEAMELWQELLALNTNSTYPYYGIATVYDANGEYKEAMEYFKLAGAHTEYSKSFREYRKTAVRENLLWILLGAAAVIAAVTVTLKLLSKRFIAVNGTAFSPMESKYTFPLYTMRHPVDGFEQLKGRNIHSYIHITLLVVIWFVIKSWEFFGMGYPFNHNRAQDYNFLITFISTIGFFIFFVVANWAVCTLFSGKGTLREIATVTAYSLLPMHICLCIRILLSNVLTQEESAFLGVILFIGIAWTVIELFAGLYAIHQYSVGGTIGSIIATLIGMFVICFLIVMFYSLIQQTVGFAQSLFEELSMR